MVGKNNQYLKSTKEGTRVESYSIKKFKVGTASVVIGASIFLGAGAVAQASDQVIDNTTINTEAKVAKEEAPKVLEAMTKIENTKESVVSAVATKVGVETPTAAKAEVKKGALKTAIATLESNLKSASDADQAAVSAAKETLAVAKDVLTNETATQAEVDGQVQAVQVLNAVVTEAQVKAETAKSEVKKSEEKSKTEEKQTAEVKEAKKELTQVTSEAEVTNVLANEAIRKNEVKIEAKPAVEKAVAKNEEVIKVANELLGNDETTKEQIAKSLERLTDSIKAVYSELENAGVRRDGRYGVALSASEGYTYSSTELRKKNGEFATATGKSYYELDGNSAYRVYVHGYQSENTEQPEAVNSVAGKNGRTDIPLSREEAQKLGTEAEMWKGKLRPTGTRIVGTLDQNAQYGSNGAYEFLATEIYGYTYEQGNHYIYVTDVKKRFSLSDAATAAGYKITNIELTNLIPGAAYNEKTDTIEGYVSSSIQNGVYDMRYKVTVSKPDGTTQVMDFQNLRSGWMGWQDTTAPLIQGSSKLVTIGDQVSHDIKYVDNDAMTRDDATNYTVNGERVIAGAKTVKKGIYNATFTAKDGSTLTTMNGPRPVTAHTTVNGTYANNGEKTTINDVIPGLDYTPQTGLITGTATEAGIFTAAVLAKDYNNATIAGNSNQWNMNGQEAHENITVAVAPKITVKNVEAYATNVPVTISKGANTAEITMPDGTVTKLVVKDGNWTVAEGTTNTAVQEGAVLAVASTTGDSTINLAVTPESTKYVGVDSIAAKATTDRVQANLQREVYTVKGANNKEYTATFNSATGKYNLPTEDAYQLVDNGNGTSTLTERRVYTDVKANGDTDYIVYEFTRTWSATSNATNLVDKIAEIREKGQVTEVGDVTRTITNVPKMQVSNTQGTIVTVNYDSVTKQWTASDGSTVTATESNAGWKLETTSGFKGYVSYREASSTDVASIQNAKPTGVSTSYSEIKGTSVDLIKSTKANVAFADTIDDKTTVTDSDTIKTKVTVVAPDGAVTNFDGAQAEETAYIQAQRTAAEKSQLAANSIKDAHTAANELANLQEQLDRQNGIEEDAVKALNNLKLRSISPTAQALAEEKLARVREYKTSLQAELEKAKSKLDTLKTTVAKSRDEAVEAEKAVETARTALKTAAEANLAKANAYVLSQKGRYKVTARAVDSNGVVTTPTVGGTDAGEVTEDAVAETTYYIVVTDPEKSSGAQGQKQTDSMADNFNDGKEGTTVSDYKLVDPTTGNKVSSVTTEQGTYTIDSTTGEVSFTPVEGFVGTATPMKVSANVTFNDEQGNPVTVATENTYTPTVYGVQPSTDETTGKQGQTQTSKSGKDRFSELNTATNTPDGTNIDWTTAAYSLEGANAEGKVVVDGEGTYSIDPKTGVVTFEPLPAFKGESKGVNVQVSVTATDSEGNKVPVTSKGKYTPTVTPVEPTGAPVTSEGKQGQEQTGTPKFTQGDETAPITINEKQPAKFVVNGQPVEDKEIPATKDGKEVGKYKVDPLTGKVTFTPNKDFTGTPDAATVEVKDANGTPTTATYTPTVTPVVPTATPKETTGKQGQPQTQDTESMFKQGDEVAPIDKTTVKLVDPSGNEVTTLPATKDGKQVGTYTLDPQTGVITFQPNKDFTGTPDAVKVVAKDTNGTKVETTYTPTVTPVKPTGEDVTSSGKQGQPQEGTPKFKQGDEVAPITINEKQPAKFVVNGQPVEDKEIPATKDGKEIGKYKIDPLTGKVTFTPNKDFTGTPDPATVEVKDKNGTPTTATYTPTVTPVVPTATPKETTGKQGQPQTQETETMFKKGDEVAPIDKTTVKLVDPSGNEVTTMPAMKDGKQVGTYTIDPATGVITFQPNKDFTGTPDAAKVVAKDTNGTKVETTYTPTVTPVTPTAEPKETTDIQGKEQTGKPTFTPGNPEVPMDDEVPATFEDGSKEKVIPGEGTYTVAPDGTVTFIPEKTFTGVGTGVTVKRVDKNGTPVTAKYTPTVTPVVPTAEPKETTDIQGKTQTGRPTFTPGNPEVPMDDEVPATFEDGSKEKVIPGEGTYTVAPDGTVTFTPEKNFIGKGTGVTVKRVDKNGTPVTAKYTPTVTPVTPEGTPAESEGPKGEPQTGTPEFKPGNPNVPIDKDVPPTFEDGTTTKVVPGEGTYTIDKDGKVTFTPEPNFVGKAKGVTVKRVDKNGTPVTATYTPTVRPDTKFVVVGKDGKETELIPSKDGKTPSEVIPGYKVVKTEVDEKGNTKHIYEKVKTSFKDKDGKEVPNYPTEDGEQPKKDIPGYRFVETKKLPNGDVEHVYEKVKTSHKDKDGKEVPNYPTENGEQPKKDIPGYRFVETKKLPNGDVEHVYEKVITPGVEKSTTWVDENGNPLKPTENGTKDPGSIPGYEFVTTVVDKDGNVQHIFKKVSPRIPTENRTTIWVDENGNPLKPTESGTVEAGKVSGYEFVRTIIDEKGNVRHIFRKVISQKVQSRRLANTGESETNTGLAGMGMAMLGGLLVAAKRRKNNNN